MGNLGPTELLIILAIIVLVFGAKKLPEFARGLGQSVKDFKSAQAEASSDSKS